MHFEEIDSVLSCLLTVARLGEKELMNWWNTDIAYKLGGADYLQRLLGPEIAPLAAAEGLINAARLKEQEIIQTMPKPDRVYSLFSPEPQIQQELNERLRHFKRYPDDLVEYIAEILNPDGEWSRDDLIQRAGTRIPDYPIEKTRFGRKVTFPSNENPAVSLCALASICVSSSSKGSYTLCYYEEPIYGAS